MTPDLLSAEMRKISVRDALKHAKSQKCSYCRESGASIVCASLCNKWLHRHCLDSSGCDYDEGARFVLLTLNPSVIDSHVVSRYYLNGNNSTVIVATGTGSAFHITHT